MPVTLKTGKTITDGVGTSYTSPHGVFTTYEKDYVNKIVSGCLCIYKDSTAYDEGKKPFMKCGVTSLGDDYDTYFADEVIDNVGVTGLVKMEEYFLDMTQDEVDHTDNLAPRVFKYILNGGSGITIADWETA